MARHQHDGTPAQSRLQRHGSFQVAPGNPIQRGRKFMAGQNVSGGVLPPPASRSVTATVKTTGSTWNFRQIQRRSQKHVRGMPWELRIISRRQGVRSADDHGRMSGMGQKLCANRFGSARPIMSNRAALSRSSSEMVRNPLARQPANSVRSGSGAVDGPRNTSSGTFRRAAHSAATTAPPGPCRRLKPNGNALEHEGTQILMRYHEQMATPVPADDGIHDRRNYHAAKGLEVTRRKKRLIAAARGTAWMKTIR